jgi:hypothetical protein
MYTKKNYLIDRLLLSMLLSCATLTCAQAAIVFRADFDAPDKMVSLGGTSGSLWQSKDYSVERLVSPPLDSAAGGFVRITNPMKATSGASRAIYLKPDKPATSWAAMHTSGKTTALNGGCDFFVRIVAATDPKGGRSWFRPIDIGEASNGGLRITLSSEANDTLRLQILAEDGGLYTSDGNPVANRSINSGFAVAAGQSYHIGFTFTTGAGGLVTMKLFGVKNVGPMETAATSPALLGTVSFKINPKVVTAGLPSGQFALCGGYLNKNQSTLDFDELRIYDAEPSSFGAIH